MQIFSGISTPRILKPGSLEMNIIHYELFAEQSMLYIISCMFLFIVLVIIGGWITDLLTYPDSPAYFLGATLSMIIAFVCTSTYVGITQSADIKYKVKITYENRTEKHIDISEKNIITKIQNNDINTNTQSQNYVYSFEINKELYTKLKTLEEKRIKESKYGFINFTD